MQLPPQTPEHHRLLANVGRWNVSCTYYTAPSPEPIRIEAIETVEALGTYFTVSLFEADFFGMPFRGRATMGYDPQRQVFVSTWVDTMTPHLFRFEGTFDAAGTTLTMHGDGPDPATGKPATYTTREEHHDDGTRTLEMFIQREGGERARIFSYKLTRAV
ncbi:MAG: DUF1579 domain-containing protein [Planctomycetes bacterium]|nr:DUF1579 domain-containing protein [Planctomycetota bacterium]MCB9891723.1 DUF1579 domain-containing protein [Planctomycetota bacterium]